MALVVTLAKVAVGYARSRGYLGGEDGAERTAPVDRERASEMLDRASDGAEKVQQLVTDLKDGKGRERLRGFVRTAAERRGIIASDEGPAEVPPTDAVTVETVNEAEADLGVNVMMTALSGAAAGSGQSIDDLLDAYNTSGAVAEAEQSAELMLRAILMAAKADGEIDAAEKQVILDSLGPDPDPDDRALVQAFLAAPVDVAGLANATPAAQIVQIYTAALVAIQLDTPPEAVFLNRLAEGLGMGERVVNALHVQMGRPLLYRQT